jgi:ribosomal protein L18
VADAYQLGDSVGRIEAQHSAHLVVFHRHPLLSGSRVALAVDRRRRVCAPGEAPFIGFENYRGVN